MLGGAFILKKYAGFVSKVAKFGFYIILFLCISAIGISGYVMYLARNTAEDVRQNAEIGNSLELPFPKEFESVSSPVEILAPIEDKTEKKEAPPVKEEKKEEVKKKEATQTPKKTEEKTVYTMAVAGSVNAPFSNGELVKSKTMDDWRIHEGVDIKAEAGTPVLAIADGVIEAVESDSMLGNTVRVIHTNGLRSVYANLGDEIKVKKGDAIKAGDTIGVIGESAISECLEPPHLHLEVISDGKHIDPLTLFPAGEE